MTKTFVSVSIVDTPGKLGKLARTLANHNINIEGFVVDRGGVRFMTAQPEEAQATLISQGYQVSLMDVFELRLHNKPGILADLAEELGKRDVNIVSTFGVSHGEEGFVYIRVDDMDAARPIMQLHH